MFDAGLQELLFRFLVLLRFFKNLKKNKKAKNLVFFVFKFKKNKYYIKYKPNYSQFDLWWLW